LYQSLACPQRVYRDYATLRAGIRYKSGKAAKQGSVGWRVASSQAHSMLALGECGRICGQRNAACFIAAAALANVSSLGVADCSKQPQISRMLMQWRIEYARCESVFFVADAQFLEIL
jgi:hypothetical protein